MRKKKKVYMLDMNIHVAKQIVKNDTLEPNKYHYLSLFIYLFFNHKAAMSWLCQWFQVNLAFFSDAESQLFRITVFQ